MSNEYIPSALEKKKVILSYMLLGLVVYIGNNRFSPYEIYHVKVAMGWWIIAVVLGSVLLLPFLLIPGFWLLGMLLYVGLFSMWGLGVWQAGANIYKDCEEKHLLSFVYALGGWFFDLFELHSASDDSSSAHSSVYQSSGDDKESFSEESVS